MNCYPDTTNWGPRSWEDASELQLEQKSLAEEFAWVTLQVLTGYRLSLCAIAIRPARASCSPGTYYASPVGGALGPFHPYVGEDGLWRNATHGSTCRCDSSREVLLPGTVSRMIGVEIDGKALSASAYRVDNGNILVRQDGGTWPLTQDMSAAAGEPGSFVVRYYSGYAPDRMAEFAAGRLAREFILLVEGAKGCKLPSSVTAVTRQGVTFEMAQSIFAPGAATGIVEVDSFVARLNPHQLKMPSRVFSIDTMEDRSTSTRGRSPVPTPPAGGSVLVPDPSQPGYYIFGGA